LFTLSNRLLLDCLFRLSLHRLGFSQLRRSRFFRESLLDGWFDVFRRSLNLPILGFFGGRSLYWLFFDLRFDLFGLGWFNGRGLNCLFEWTGWHRCLPLVAGWLFRSALATGFLL
jgi:hypothetical protein